MTEALLFKKMTNNLLSASIPSAAQLYMNNRCANREKIIGKIAERHFNSKKMSIWGYVENVDSWSETRKKEKLIMSLNGREINYCKDPVIFGQFDAKTKVEKGSERIYLLFTPMYLNQIREVEIGKRGIFFNSRSEFMERLDGNLGKIGLENIRVERYSKNNEITCMISAKAPSRNINVDILATDVHAIKNKIYGDINILLAENERKYEFFITDPDLKIDYGAIFGDAIYQLDEKCAPGRLDMKNMPHGNRKAKMMVTVSMRKAFSGIYDSLAEIMAADIVPNGIKTMLLYAEHA